MSNRPDPEVMEPDECWRLLGKASIGRLGLHVGAMPLVVPVNYALLVGTIVFRTAAGSRLANAICNTVVAFEVDDADLASHEGWSVVVVGISTRVTDQESLDAVMDLPLGRWAPGAQRHVTRIEPTIISGRRLVQWDWGW